MKNKLAFSLPVLMVIGLASIAQAQHAAGSTEKAISALERTWTESQQTNNPDMVAPLLADKFAYTAVDGKVSDKAASLAEWKETKWTSVVYTDEKVTVFGDTAIARGESKGKVIDSSGKPAEYHNRYTDVWVKMPSGKWQCVSSQDSPLAK